MADRSYAIDTLVLPPVVTGYGLLLLLGRNGWIGRWLDQWLGIQVVFTWYAAMLAAAIMAFPLMVRTIRVSMASVDRRLEQAARVHGASGWRTFFRVTLPLSQRGIIAGALLAFARSLGEFGATIMIAGNLPGETQTIPLYIYTLVNSPGGLEKCTRIVLVSFTLAILAVLIAEYLERHLRSEQAGKELP